LANNEKAHNEALIEAGNLGLYHPDHVATIVVDLIEVPFWEDSIDYDFV